MRPLSLLRSAGFSPLASQSLVVPASSEYVNATWPPAHYSWVVTSDGFKNQSQEAQFQSESSSGHFCRDRKIPVGVQRVLFPTKRGKLGFNGTRSDANSWVVNLVFDDLRKRGTKQSYTAKSTSSWVWNKHERNNQLYCSNTLTGIQEIPFESTAWTDSKRHGVSGSFFRGFTATLGIEMIRREPGSTSDKNITTVVRQCTFIQFVRREDLRFGGPCNNQPSPASNTPFNQPWPGVGSTSPPSVSFEIWATLAIVLATTSIIGAAAFYLRWRRKRLRKLNGEPEGTVHDAAAARLRRQEQFVPAPDYTTANGGVALPTYDEATRK